MIREREAREFLASGRLAVVGASADRRQFGNTVFRALLDSGIEAVPVNPTTADVEGHQCFPDVEAVPGVLDGVIVMVAASRAVDVVRACGRRGVPRVWLFRGIGGPGALSDEVVAAAREQDMAVIAGACPLMFLEPVAAVHRVHRTVRRMRRALAST